MQGRYPVGMRWGLVAVNVRFHWPPTPSSVVERMKNTGRKGRALYLPLATLAVRHTLLPAHIGRGRLATAPHPSVA